MTEPRPHAELEELLGAYALDAVEGEEREELELHLRDCPRCRAEVADHREVAGRLAYGGSAAPEGVWDRIAESLEATPPELDLTVRVPGGTQVVPLGDGTPRRRRSWSTKLLAGLGAAALVAVVVLGVGLVRQNDEIGDLEGQLREVSLERVARGAFEDPDARRIVLTSPDGRLTAPMAMTPDGSGYLMASELPELSGNETYQLWQVTGGQEVSLGTFRAATVVAFGASSDAEQFVVTREAGNGVPTPLGPAVVAGDA